MLRPDFLEDLKVNFYKNFVDPNLRGMNDDTVWTFDINLTHIIIQVHSNQENIFSDTYVRVKMYLHCIMEFEI